MSANLNTILNSQEVPPTNAPAAAPAASPAPAAPPEWLSVIPEAYRADPNIVAHSNLDSLLAEYGSLKVTGGKLTVPPADAPYEAHKEFYTQLGVPESPDKYAIAMPEGFPEGFPMNQEFVNKIQDVAHKYKIPAAGLQELAKEYFGLEKSAIDQQLAEVANRSAQDVETLKSLWGTEFDTRADFARKGFQQFANADTIQRATDSGLIGNPTFLHIMSEIGKAMTLPQSPGASSSSGSGVQQQIVTSPAQAQAAIRALYDDPVKGKALANPRDPLYKTLQGELEMLYSKAYQ